MYVTPDTAKVIKYPLLTQIMALKKKKKDKPLLSSVTSEAKI